MTVRDETRLLGASALLVLVLAIALAIRAGAIEAADAALLRGAADLPGWLRDAAVPVTRIGDSATRLALAALIGVALWLARRRPDALFLAGAVGGGALFNSLLKWAFDRTRPELLPRLDAVHSTSFPSGHAAGSAEICLALALVAIRCGASARLAWPLAFVGMLTIGGSRVLLAVHWPSDVVAGWCAGTAWFLLLWEALAVAERRAQG